MSGDERTDALSDDELDELVVAASALLTEGDWDELLAGPLPATRDDVVGPPAPLAPPASGPHPDAGDGGASGPGISSGTELESPRPRRKRSTGWRLAPIALAAAAALVVVLVVRDPEPSVDPASPSSTTSAVPATTTTEGPPVLEHPVGVADRSAELQTELADLDALVHEVTGDPNLLGRSLAVSQQFSPRSFPDLTPLPTRATWVFSNPAADPPGRCDRFVPAPPTMDGFAGVGFGSAATLTTVTTYTFTDEASAADFLAGRSLLLGVGLDECEARPDARRPSVRHRSFDPSPAPDAFDDWNTWTLSAPEDLLLDETGAFGFLGRIGDQLVEVRIGAVDPSTIGTDDFGRLIGEVANRIGGP